MKSLATGGVPWNGYSWDITLSLDDPLCVFNSDGIITTTAFSLFPGGLRRVTERRRAYVR